MHFMVLAIKFIAQTFNPVRPAFIIIHCMVIVLVHTTAGESSKLSTEEVLLQGSKLVLVLVPEVGSPEAQHGHFKTALQGKITIFGSRVQRVCSLSFLLYSQWHLSGRERSGKLPGFDCVSRTRNSSNSPLPRRLAKTSGNSPYSCSGFPESPGL
jgi:hypothetical protein